MSYKVGLVSLGCAKNLIDSEMMLAMFQGADFEITSDPKEADLIIVNTCAFIESAKKESIATIMEMAKNKAKIAVVGCLAERYSEELKKSLKEADLIVPIKDYSSLSSLLTKLTKEKGIVPLNPLRRVISTAEYSAYLRISDGCNNFCAFCAIPFIRGRFHSRPYEEIIQEAKDLKEKGVKELSLVSQDTTRYGFDFANQKPNIVDLLKELDSLGFYSIRLLYLYPDEISDELILTIKNSKSIAHYFDIPIQCGSDHMIKAMKRHGNKKDTLDLFTKIKDWVPDAVLRTTLIAGFPGETEEDQAEALEILKEISFDHAGAFTYSREEGTAAFSYPNQIDEKIKKKRLDELMDEQKKISFRQNKKRIGSYMEGLVISYGPKSQLYGLRSSWNAPDEIDGDLLFKAKTPHKLGDIVKVKITDAFVYDLLGEEVSKEN